MLKVGPVRGVQESLALPGPHRALTETTGAKRSSTARTISPTWIPFNLIIHLVSSCLNASCSHTPIGGRITLGVLKENHGEVITDYWESRRHLTFGYCCTLFVLYVLIAQGENDGLPSVSPPYRTNRDPQDWKRAQRLQQVQRALGVLQTILGRRHLPTVLTDRWNMFPQRWRKF